VKLGAPVWVIHAFQKKSKTGIRTPKQDIELIRQRLRRLQEDRPMSESNDLEVVRGSGNVFRDLRLPDADTEQMKAALDAEILKAMREQGLTHAAAAERAEVQRADVSRICKVDLDRFTIDRLVRIANRLDRRVEVVVSVVEPRRAAKELAT
jgi:predicted XRE-type DNA-binding protein